MLELILPKDRALSEKHANEKEMLSARARQEGYGDFSDVAEAGGTVSSLLFGEYLLENFSSFTDEGKGGALDYELEYILAGAGSDKENLEKVARKLMMLRFVPNYAYIQTDGEMKQKQRRRPQRCARFLPSLPSRALLPRRFFWHGPTERR